MKITFLNNNDTVKKGIKMRNFTLIKIVALVIFIVLSSVSFTGCGGTDAVEESTIFEDIKRTDAYCSVFDFTYDSMEVIKRMTDEEAKTDKAWVDFKCHNADFEYTVECVVDYVLYNEGWIFENYEILSSNYNALSFPDEAKIREDFNYINLETVKDLTHDTVDIENANVRHFSGVYNDIVSEYFYWTVTTYISYEFTPETGWVGTETESETGEISHFGNWNWDAFVGEWERKDSTDIYSDEINKINIRSIDSQSITADFFNDDWDFGYGEHILTTIDMEYVTGSYALLNVLTYPTDIPVYKVWVSGDELGDHIFITPYGIYSAYYIERIDDEFVKLEYIWQ